MIIRSSKIIHVFLVLSILAFALLCFGCGEGPSGYKGVKNIYTAKGSSIVCFGDSLTIGEGARRGGDFPAVLRAKLDIPVVNSGVSGDTTFSALTRVERDVLNKDPMIVIVELGANDYLSWGSWRHGPSTEETFRNIYGIVETIQKRGAVVVIAAIPFDPDYEKRYKKLAKDTGSVLIPNIMKGILGNPSLMSLDRIHPNDEGYKVMADNILKVLEPLINEMKGAERSK